MANPHVLADKPYPLFFKKLWVKRSSLSAVYDNDCYCCHGTECPLHHRKSLQLLFYTLEQDIFPVLIQEPALPTDQ